MKKTSWALRPHASDIASSTTVDSVYPLLGGRGSAKALRTYAKRLLDGMVASRYTVPLLVLVGFFLFSFGFHGPAYMSDEVGYLDKAATIAGSTVHLSTSWFGGYSFMISPAFFFSSDPAVEWNIIVVLNALMWAGSAALLQYILRRLYPHTSDKAVFFATLATMLYPSWIAMSSYAFATSGFVLVFMAALAAILKSELKSAKWLSVAGVLAGYLCWIHPLGFLFLGLFVVVLFLQGFRKRPVLLMIAFGSLVVEGVYLGLVQPWLDRAMNGSITNDDHYAAGAHTIEQAVVTFHYWLQVGEMLAGLVFFLVVATFGLGVYGALPVIKQLFANRKAWKKSAQDPEVIVRLLPVLLVMAVMVLTALQFAALPQRNVDQWVHGRYTDMYLMPLLAYGLLANWKPRTALKLAAFVLGAGILLSLVTNPANTAFGYDNKLNLESLWPMHLASIVHLNQYWVWGVLGTVGVVWCGLMGGKHKAYLAFLILPVVLAGAGNYIYKQTITTEHASLSSMYQYIRAKYTASDCIGFTPVADSNERFNLYSYYLHGYDIKKMTLQQWQQQKCQGPYLTYDASASSTAHLQIVGQEAQTGLYMFAPSGSKLSFAKHGRHNIFTNKLVGSSIRFR